MATERKKFRVSAEVTISLFTEVEAATEEEAIEIAEGRGVMDLCHYCADSRSSGSEWVTSGELDGTPQKLQVESWGA